MRCKQRCEACPNNRGKKAVWHADEQSGSPVWVCSKCGHTIHRRDNRGQRIRTEKRMRAFCMAGA